MLMLEKVSFFPSKLIAVISPASTVDHAFSVCFMVPMFMCAPFGKIKPEVGLQLYTKAVEVAGGSWSSCVDYADSVSGFSRRCPSGIVSVWTLFS